MVKKYDYLIVGAGLFGSTFANLAHRRGKRCLVIDKRPHLGGNVYCENVDGITIHKYGPHIFHTSDKKVWDYVNSFVPFNQFTLNIVAISNGKLYNLPFNMHTFYQMWGVTKPEDAVAIIERQKATANIQSPHNLEEQAISLVGHDVYETLIKGYTEKQWGRPCRELPADIIKRLPVRFSFNNNYFNDKYQGIPEGGYNVLIDGLLEGVECRTDCNYIDNRSAFKGIADKIVPDAVPALDVPALFGFAPNSLMLGFIFAVIGMIVAMFISSALFGAVPLVSIIGAFFTGGVAGIMGNALGGRRGAMVAGFVYGLELILFSGFTYKLFGEFVSVGAQGTGHDCIDAMALMTAMKSPIIGIVLLIGGFVLMSILEVRYQKRRKAE